MKAFKSMIVVTSLIATTSFAKTSPLPPQLRKAVLQFQRVTKPHKKASSQCANFSGNWQGTCVDKHGDVETDKFVIKQDDCVSMNFDGFDYNLNGSVTITSTPDPFDNALSYGGTIAYAWNDSQTKLRRLTSLNLDNGKAAGVFNSSLWLSGDTLRVKDEFATPLIEIDGISNLEVVENDCTYTKN